MTFRPPIFVGPDGAGNGVRPQDARLALSYLAPSTGLLSGCAVTGVSGQANMTYSIAAGAVALARGTITTDGVYISANDGPYQVSGGAPAPASGSRYDLIYVAPRNGYAQDGFNDASSLPNVNVAVGTASGTPARPTASVPTGGLVLAEALIPAGAASAAAGGVAISQVAPWAAGIMQRVLADWNTALAPGFYYGQSGVAANAPDSNNGFVGIVVTSPVSGWVIQNVWRIDGSGEQWVRQYTSGGTWNPWQLVSGGDTGIVSTGAMARTSPHILNSYTISKVGKLVVLSVSINLGSALSSVGTGNIGNTEVATVTQSKYFPRFGVGLTPAGTGPMCAGFISAGGSVQITALIPGVTYPTGTTFSLAGSYLAA